ncbi:hypothetical protein JB92DRAFT_2747830 [Gautieria morchelliformis]|nr:hypothetical protein JB92DRAFT_2747830 [Gautieria morchelliformis]
MLRLTLRSSNRLATSHRRFTTKHVNKVYLEHSAGVELPADFRFFPTFLTGEEQRVLFLSALGQLDNVGSRESRRKRKRKQITNTETPAINDLFLPDEYYDFEEGHYDGVIMHFRETIVTSWPDHPSLESVLLRLRGLLPTTLQGGIQTHLLHLASNGHILPHVDNIEASGSWIAAVSLGGERVLRMENEVDKEKSFEILLPSGSVYVQSNAVRYSYKHSILPGGTYFKGRYVPSSQRISVMLRVSSNSVASNILNRDT